MNRYVVRNIEFGSSVSVVTRLRTGRQVIVSRHGRGTGCSSSPLLPYRLWSPFTLVSSGYRGVFCRG